MTNAARDVILAAMAWAEPATEITARVCGFVAERNATKMGANANHHDPLLMTCFDARHVGCRVEQIGLLHTLSRLDFFWCTVTHEHRLAAPNDGHALTRWN